MKSTLVVGTILTLLPVSLAQQSVWGQCGGNGWTGSKTCASGSYCKYVNDWYSQCVPGTASTTVPSTTNTSTSSASTTKTTTSTSSTSTSTGTAKAKYWFSFGDSYTATGFSATGNQPSASNIIGNPSYPGNSQCGNGLATWVVYAANSLDPSLSRLYNYAVSGATIDNSIVGSFSSSIPSVSDQVKTFLNNHAPGKQYYAGWSSSGTLFSVWIGINDIGSSYSSKPLTINDTLLNRYFQLMQSLYDVGARNFLFLTVPPVYKSPLMLSQSSSNRDSEKTMIDDYNKKLATKAAAFASANSGVTVQVYDTTPLINAILSSPSTYGLRDATSSGSGSTYAWCDVYHISPAVHSLVAKDVAALVQKTYACWSDFLYC